MTEYERVKETEDNFQKECELQMEEYQQKIKYLQYLCITFTLY